MAWTEISQPSGPTSVLVVTGGVPIGLLLALTASQSSVLTMDNWTEVPGATGSWTSIASASVTTWTSVLVAT